MRNRIQSQTETGVGVVEFLIAMALLLVILTAVVPLFYRATASNISAQESAQSTIFAQAEAERYFDLNFNDVELTVAAGSTTFVVDRMDASCAAPCGTGSNTTELAWDPSTAVWYRPTGPGTRDIEPADLYSLPNPDQYQRRVTVRQYNMDAILDGVIDEAEALPAGTDPSRIHFKRVTVQIQGGLEMPQIPRQPIDIEMMKAN